MKCYYETQSGRGSKFEKRQKCHRIIYLGAYLSASIVMMMGFTVVLGHMIDRCSPKVLPNVVKMVSMSTVALGIYWLIRLPFGTEHLL